MKELLISSTFFLALFMFSCGDESGSSDEAAMAEASLEATPEPEAEPMAVCLWDKAGLRENPGSSSKDNKYLATIVFGETVILTGESQEATDDRTYLKVKLSDGQEGWVNEYLFALNATLAAATGPIEVYRRPDLLTGKGERFEAGKLISLVPGDNPDWVEVFGQEKKPQGWAQKGQNMSEDKTDVAVAVLYAKAMQEDNPTKREELLQSIAQNTAFSKSQLISMIDQALVEASSAPKLADNQMSILGDNLNVRREPTTEGENVVFQLKKGDICRVLEKGQQEQIRDMNDYWYKISYDGQEGWVYGHHTSRRAE